MRAPLWHWLVGLLYRERCAACRAWTTEPLCGGCEAAWPPPPTGLCFGCGTRIGAMRPACDACADAPPAFEAVVAAGAYAGVARQAVHALKYHKRRAVAWLLARRLADMPSFPRGDWLIVPVPLHPKRLRERGFNQAELIARALGRQCRLPTRDWLVRRHATAPQHELGREGRLENLADAFGCKRRLDGRRVLLVDDVMTTGATAHWAAHALLAAGAIAVRLAIVARTEPPGS